MSIGSVICPHCGTFLNFSTIIFRIRRYEKEIHGKDISDNNDIINDLNIEYECCKIIVLSAHVDQTLELYIHDYYDAARKKILSLHFNK